MHRVRRHHLQRAERMIGDGAIDRAGFGGFGEVATRRSSGRRCAACRGAPRDLVGAVRRHADTEHPVRRG